jgi:hypothetical protein
MKFMKNLKLKKEKENRINYPFKDLMVQFQIKKARQKINLYNLKLIWLLLIIVLEAEDKSNLLLVTKCHKEYLEN